MTCDSFGEGVTSPSIGVLLAAGRSRRMGRSKLTMMWPPDDGHSTVVASAFDGLTPLVDAGIIVVTSEDRLDELRDALRERSCVIITADGGAPMFESVRAGLRAATRHTAELAGVWLHPGDHPIISEAVRRALRAAVERTPNQPVMPTCSGKGGHPVWIPCGWCERLVDEQGEGGLRAIWERYPMEVQRVPVDDASCILDLDTPDDYARAAGRRNSGD